MTEQEMEEKKKMISKLGSRIRVKILYTDYQEDINRFFDEMVDAGHIIELLDIKIQCSGESSGPIHDVACVRTIIIYKQLNA